MVEDPLILGAGDIGAELSWELKEPVGISRTRNQDFEGETILSDLKAGIPVRLSEFDSIYHLATKNSGTEDYGWRLPDVQATRNVVEQLKRIEEEPELVYVSSCSSLQVSPGTGELSYPEAKASGEMIANEYPNTTVVRLGNVYGDGKGVVDHFIEKAEEGEEIVVHGDGTQQKPFIHIEDAVEALRERPFPEFNAFEDRYSVQEIAEYISDLSSSEIVYKSGKDSETVEAPASSFETNYCLEEYIEQKLES